MVNFGKNAVVFSDVKCLQLSRFHKNRTTSRIAHKTALHYTVDYVIEPISGCVDRASVAETVNSGSIPGRVKPETIKISFQSFIA